MFSIEKTFFELLIMSFSEVREFVTRTAWLDELGHPFGDAAKQAVLRNMNNQNLSDFAAVTYSDRSDQVELWYTRYQPFSENGTWAIIPGWRLRIAELERQFGPTKGSG